MVEVHKTDQIVVVVAHTINNLEKVPEKQTNINSATWCFRNYKNKWGSNEQSYCIDVSDYISWLFKSIHNSKG